MRFAAAFGMLLLVTTLGTGETSRVFAGGQITVIETVGGTQGPWNYVIGGLNTNYQYGPNDQAGPTVTSAANGIDFTPGGVLTVTYVSGAVFSPGGSGNGDANGELNYIFDNNPGSTGKFAPSYYMNHSTYPIYLVELVGTFANSTGAIVGTPFALGNGPTMLTIPTGATQLQLGANDDLYSDNTGSWTISVTGPALASVPEPSSILLLEGRKGVRNRKDESVPDPFNSVTHLFIQEWHSCWSRFAIVGRCLSTNPDRDASKGAIQRWKCSSSAR